MQPMTFCTAHLYVPNKLLNYNKLGKKYVGSSIFKESQKLNFVNHLLVILLSYMKEKRETKTYY